MPYIWAKSAKPAVPESSTMAPHAPGFLPECPIDSDHHQVSLPSIPGPGIHFCPFPRTVYLCSLIYALYRFDSESIGHSGMNPGAWGTIVLPSGIAGLTDLVHIYGICLLVHLICSYNNRLHILIISSKVWKWAKKVYILIRVFI